MRYRIINISDISTIYYLSGGKEQGQNRVLNLLLSQIADFATLHSCIEKFCWEHKVMLQASEGNLLELSFYLERLEYRVVGEMQLLDEV